MVEIRRVSNGVMAVVLVFEVDVLRLICGYAPQSGRSLEEKQSFYDLKAVVRGKPGNVSCKYIRFSKASFCVSRMSL